MIHHRIAIVIMPGLDGKLDGRIVNGADEAPMSIYDASQLVGDPLGPSAASFEKAWRRSDFGNG